MKTETKSKSPALRKLTLALGLAALTAVALPTVTTIITNGKLFYHGIMMNVVLRDNVLRLGNDTTPTTFASGYKLFGIYTSGENTAKTPFQAIGFSVSAMVPTNSAL